MWCLHILAVLIVSPIIGSHARSKALDEQRPYFRNDYKLLTNPPNFYKLHETPMNFSNAVALCAAEGAHLFTPRALKESETIFSLYNNSSALWIGVHDIFSEGSFVNLDGETKFYVNWGANEPNDAADNEDCVVLRKDNTFNDIWCGSKFPFVCERSTENLTYNDLCDTYDLDYEYNETLVGCYKLHTHPMTWGDAFKICIAEQSSLVIINSDAEAQYLVSQMEKYPESKMHGRFDKTNFLIGFNDLINEGVHLTNNGKLLSEAGYEKWASGQPDDYNIENCGSIFRDGKLNDISCTARAMFFCEKSLKNRVDLGLDIRIQEAGSA